MTTDCTLPDPSKPKDTAINDTVYDSYHVFRSEVRIVPEETQAKGITLLPALLLQCRQGLQAMTFRYKQPSPEKIWMLLYGVTDSRLTKASSQLRTMVLRESLRGLFPSSVVL